MLHRPLYVEVHQARSTENAEEYMLVVDEVEEGEMVVEKLGVAQRQGKARGRSHRYAKARHIEVLEYSIMALQRQLQPPAVSSVSHQSVYLILNRLPSNPRISKHSRARLFSIIHIVRLILSNPTQISHKAPQHVASTPTSRSFQLPRPPANHIAT